LIKKKDEESFCWCAVIGVVVGLLALGLRELMVKHYEINIFLR
jgi:hypothetical protein